MKKVLGLIFVLFAYVNLGAMNHKPIDLIIATRNEGSSSGKLKKIIDNGINPNCRDDKGNTPLHWSVAFNHLDKAEILIKHGANIISCNEAGDTPLHWVARSKNEDSFKFLIKKLIQPFHNMHIPYMYQDDPIRRCLHVKNNSGESVLDICKKKGILHWIPEIPKEVMRNLD